MVEWNRQLDRAQAIEEEKQEKQHNAAMEANAHIKNQVMIIFITFTIDRSFLQSTLNNQYTIAINVIEMINFV